MELGLCSSLKPSSIEFRWESPLPSTEEGLGSESDNFTRDALMYCLADKSNYLQNRTLTGKQPLIKTDVSSQSKGGRET